MDKRCETCKWWGGYFSSSPKWAGSRGEPAFAGQRYCALTETHDGSAQLVTKARAVWGENEGPAVLYTDADFGCVQWEAKG